MDGGTGEVSGAVPLDRLARAAVLDVHSRPGGAAIDSVAAGDGRWWLHVLGVTREWKEVRFLARLRGWPERKDNPPGKNEPPPSTLSPPPRAQPSERPGVGRILHACRQGPTALAMPPDRRSRVKCGPVALRATPCRWAQTLI